MPRADAALIEQLGLIVGGAHVLVGRELTEGYSVDWTGRFRGEAAAVVRPGTTGEVAAVVTACAAAGVSVVPQGGNTGLVGGGVPRHGEVVISSRRLGALGPVDVVARQVTVGAGATLAEVAVHCAPYGLEPPVDLAPRDSCTIGGMVATNAGGTRVVRHGTMRRHVAGVEAVLGDGSTISHLQGLGKDNTGYDLAGLLTGSEGTLGIVTAVRLGLVPVLAERVVVGLAFAHLAGAVAAVPVLVGGCPQVDAIELVLAPGVELVGSKLGLPVPDQLRAPAVLLVELAADHEPMAGLAAVIEDLRLAHEPVVATDPAARARLWAIRERHAEAINLLGPPLKLDVTVPLAETVGFLAEVDGLVPGGARTVVFGHLGDGNLHVNIVGLDPSGIDDVEGGVLAAAARRGGSISAEHGIGTAKARYLHLVRGPAELAAFAAIKHALDPAGIMNPAVLLGLPGGRS